MKKQLCDFDKTDLDRELGPLMQQAGYTESVEKVIGDLNWWSLTMQQAKGELAQQIKDLEKEAAQ